MIDINWNEIKVDYMAGWKPKALVEKYKINYKTLTNHISRNNWVQEHKEVEAAVADKIKNLEIEKIDEVLKKEQSDVEKIEKLIWKSITEIGENGEARIKDLNPDDVNKVTNAFFKLSQMRHKAYRIPDNIEVKTQGIHLIVHSDFAPKIKEEI
jgi:hypothetical protein